MKRKKKLILSIVVLLVVGSGASYLGYRHLMGRRLQAWRQDGFAASRAGDHERAVDLLVRYLQRNPDDTEALAQYIRSREVAELPNGQHLAETIGALKLLLGQDPDRLADRRHLLNLYVKLGRRPEALDTANALLAKHPADVPTLEAKTSVLRGLYQDREALTVAEQWTKAAPRDLKAYMAWLSLRARVGHPPEAIVASAEQARTANPGDPRFELLQGFAYAQTGDDAQAAQWLKRVAAHKDLTEDTAEILIAQFDSLGLVDDALAALQEMVARGMGTRLRRTLASRLWELGRWEQAADALADLNPADPQSDATLVAFKAVALANAGRKPEAQACRAALAGRNQAAARAWVLLLRRAIDAAAVDDKEVLRACREAVLLDPDNAYLDYYYGEASARLGELDTAIEAWRRVVGQNLTWNAPAVRLVDALLQKGRPEQAMSVASAAARRSPNNAAAVISLARAWALGVESGGVVQTDELLKLVNDVQKQLPGEAQTLLIHVQMLGQQGKTDEAAKLIRAAIGRTPPPPEGLFLALATASRRFGLGVEAECFTRAEQAHGPSAALAYARAFDQFAAGRADAGLQAFDDQAKRAGKAGDRSWRLARARYLDVTGNAGAHAAWVALGDAHPNDLSVQQAAADARAVRGDWDFTLRTVDRLRALTGDTGLAWRLAKARLLVEAARTDADHEQGAVLLNEVIREYPHLPAPRVLLARALVQMKRLDGAVEHLSVAARSDPTSVPIALQLASLLQSRGDFDRVRQELDRVAPRLRSSAERRQAAVLLARQGNEEQAVRVLQQPQPQQGKAEPADQDDLFLAVLHRQRGQPDLAEAVVRKLLDRQPDLATVQFAASLFASQGRRAEADRVLARLDALKLEPGVKELARGSFHAEVGEHPEAEKRYRAATEQAPGNPVAWRVLAVSQLAGGRSEEALATIDATLRALPADPGFAAVKQHAALVREAGADDGLRSVAVSIVRDPQNSELAVELLRTVLEGRRTQDMERLAVRLQQLAERNPASLPVQVQLVQAYWAMGRTTDALAAARRAGNAFPNSPEPARLIVQVCSAAGRWSDMHAAAQAWKKRAGADAQAADLAIAWASIGMKRFDAAAEQLRPYLAAAVAQPDRHADLLSMYGLAELNTGRGEAAAVRLWPLAAKSAPWRARWVFVALGSQDPALAAAWLDRVAAVMPATAIGERVVLAEGYERLAATGHANGPQWARKASETFGQIIANPAATAAALSAAGTHAERAGDLTTAEALYRRAVAKDANLYVAANNLASVIARRGGDPKEAMHWAAAAVRLKPQQATVHDTLAQTQLKAGDHKGAADSMSGIL